LDKKRQEESAKETRGQVLRLCFEGLVVVLMLAIVIGGVVTLGRHMVATDTPRTYPQTAGRLVTYVDAEGRVVCAVLDTPRSKDIEVSSLEQKQGLVGDEGVDCEVRYRVLGSSTRVPGGGH
jgi:hypothetical protein